MTDSGKAFTDQHDVDELDENVELENNHEDPLTPETIDDNNTEVGSNQVQENNPLSNEIKKEDEIEDQSSGI